MSNTHTYHAIHAKRNTRAHESPFRAEVELSCFLFVVAIFSSVFACMHVCLCVKCVMFHMPRFLYRRFSSLLMFSVVVQTHGVHPSYKTAKLFGSIASRIIQSTCSPVVERRVGSGSRPLQKKKKKNERARDGETKQIHVIRTIFDGLKTKMKNEDSKSESKK